ncbi:MAG TPA: TauD/TfdA family dioxygenase [Stellaceae bacterium]|jgi:taurine dioxygenase|nr:TauD/TfdA family dioxygenase [Stellaceae bacterium]
MTMQVKPLTDLLGAEISGIDLTQPLDDATKKQLYKLFADNAVVVIRDQHFTPQQFAAAAELFGEIVPEQFLNYRLPEFPKVSFLSNKDLEKTGKKRAVRGEGFHTDHSNYAAPPKATILYGIDIPQSGGNTEYVSVQAAYDDLSDKVKRDIAGLKAVHAYKGTRDKHKSTALAADELSKTPSALHPLARLNPDNGKIGLYLCPGRVTGIDGMDDDDAFALMDRLYAHATQAKYLYSHKWRKGDMVVWDNRSVLHQATTDYDMDESRYLYRVLVAGEVPVNAPSV